MRKTSILIIILMVLSTFGHFRQIFFYIARLINLIESVGINFSTYDGVFTYDIYSYTISQFLYVIQSLTSWLCTIVFGVLLIRRNNDSKAQCIEASIRAKIEIKKEEIIKKRTLKSTTRAQQKKEKFQKKLEKLNNESDE